MTHSRWLGLQGWLIAALIGVGFLASLAVLATVLPTLEQSVRRDRAADVAGAITEIVQANAPTEWGTVYADYGDVARRIANQTGGQVLVLQEGGVELGRSPGCCGRIESFGMATDYAAPRSQLRGDGSALLVSVPMAPRRGPEAIGLRGVVVQVAVPITGSSAELAFIQRRLMLAVAVVFGLAALAGYALARFIGRRISRLAVTASRLASGDLAARAPLRGPQELATLGDGLNMMASRIEAQVEAITGERDRARMLISSLAEGVVSVLDDSAIGMINPAAMQILGIRDDRRPATVAELPPPVLRAITDAARSNDPVTETEAVLRNGTELDIVIARLAAPATGLVVTLRDVTDDRRLQRARRDLVANVSHELKTPLAAIKGLLEILESDSVDTRHRQEFLALMSAEADRLERLVEEQLQLARLDAGALPLEIERIDLDALADGVADSRRVLAEAAGVTLRSVTPGYPVSVYADGARVEQILLILIDNALRHTRDGGSIEIRVSMRDGQAHLDVADTGEGIAADDLPFVFDRFYRGDPSREGRSAGLGLAIARGLAAAHGGVIQVSSTPGEGSTFTLSLPSAVAPTAEHPIPDAAR